MPNHVKNEITLKGAESEIMRFYDLYKPDEEYDEAKFFLDFHKVIPRPAGTDLDIESNGLTGSLDSKYERTTHLSEFIKNIQQYLIRNGAIDEKALDNFTKAIKNKAICNHATWYSWNIENWGTKWSAYDQERMGNTIRFETAWSHPRPILEKMFKDFPGLSFEVKFADEDYGSNLGHYLFSGGTQVDFGISELEKFAVELHGNYSSYDEYKKDMEEDNA